MGGSPDFLSMELPCAGGRGGGSKSVSQTQEGNMATHRGRESRRNPNETGAQLRYFSEMEGAKASFKRHADYTSYKTSGRADIDCVRIGKGTRFSG